MKYRGHGGEMTNKLAARYLNTELVFNLDGHGAWLLRPEHVGGNPPTQHAKLLPPTQLAETLGLEHPALVVTAANPAGSKLDPHLNGLRNTRLFWNLKNLGLEIFHCIGRSMSEPHEEPSFWVPTRGAPGVDLAVQVEAKKFGQDAIFRVRPGEIELVGVEIPDLSGAVPAAWWRAESA